VNVVVRIVDELKQAKLFRMEKFVAALCVNRVDSLLARQSNWLNWTS